MRLTSVWRLIRKAASTTDKRPKPIIRLLAISVFECTVHQYLGAHHHI